MMGDGYIDFTTIGRWVTEAGYSGDVEVEIFNADIWARRRERSWFHQRTWPAGPRRSGQIPRIGHRAGGSQGHRSGGCRRRWYVAGNPVVAGWRLTEDGQAIIEMARASGLLLAGGAGGNDPWAAPTAGTGELVLAATDAGASRTSLGWVVRPPPAAVSQIAGFDPIADDRVAVCDPMFRNVLVADRS
jgi:hypothetical protein